MSFWTQTVYGVASEHMVELTQLQRVALRCIKNYHEIHGYMPSERDLAMAMALTQNAAVNHLKALEKKGYIRRASGKARAISILKTVE